MNSVIAPVDSVIVIGSFLVVGVGVGIEVMVIGVGVVVVGGFDVTCLIVVCLFVACFFIIMGLVVDVGTGLVL